MKYGILLSRIIIGLIFILAGLTKANDPIGLVYKLNDFFEIVNLDQLVNYTQYISIFLIAFEIIGGVAIIVGNSFRFYITLLLILCIFYTFVTGYALYSGTINECEFFGNYSPVAHAVSFYKYVALTGMCYFLYFNRYNVNPLINNSGLNSSIVIVAAIIALGCEWYTWHHGPVYDRLPFKVGVNIWEDMHPSADATAAEYQTTFTYEKNGIKQEFSMENYPWKDSSWNYLDRKDKFIKEPSGLPEIQNFSLTDSTGKDQTQAILTAKGYVFLWFIRQPEKAKTKNMATLRKLITQAESLHIPFYMVCSSDTDICNTYKEAWNINEVPYLLTDGTVSEIAMHTNPGLMLLLDGTVARKWSYYDYPKEMTMDNGSIEIK